MVLYKEYYCNLYIYIYIYIKYVNIYLNIDYYIYTSTPNCAGRCFSMVIFIPNRTLPGNLNGKGLASIEWNAIDLPGSPVNRSVYIL